MTIQEKSITITFERMPGVSFPVVMRFDRYECANRMWELTDAVICTGVIPHHGHRHLIGCGSAVRAPQDKFDWDTAMRVSARRAFSNKTIMVFYRAFRRWMWLAQGGYLCHQAIAREFGRVTVEVK